MSSKGPRELILGIASHLDAFSAYLTEHNYPAPAVGTTTGTSAVPSPRSSRTRSKFPQFSNACGG